MSGSGSVRRRPSGMVVVGAAEPEVRPWLRAAGNDVRTLGDADSAPTAVAEEPVDLVIADRERGRRVDVADVCRENAGTAANR